MPTWRIERVDVDFPFQPYDCQKLYMSKVIQSLKNVSAAAFMIILFYDNTKPNQTKSICFCAF